MKYVTRAHAKVDRIACPWLIKRFIDAEAKFLFVDADKVIETAERESAIPFDVPNVELGHHGLRCSFDAIVENVAKGKRVTVVGFGTFLPRKRKARAGRSPLNGKEIKICAKTLPAFAAGQGFKQAVDKTS